MASKTRCLVTGGCGFLGLHLVRQLLEDGRFEVSVFDVRPTDVPKGAHMIVGDLRSTSSVDAAVKGMDPPPPLLPPQNPISQLSGRV